VREEDLGFRSDLLYWQQVTQRQLQLNITNLLSFVHSFEDHCNEDKRVDLSEFREMLGFIGSSFIGERMFNVIITPGRKDFSLAEYLIY